MPVRFETRVSDSKAPLRVPRQPTAFAPGDRTTSYSL